MAFAMLYSSLNEEARRWGSNCTSRACLHLAKALDFVASAEGAEDSLVSKSTARHFGHYGEKGRTMYNRCVRCLAEAM